MSLLKALAYETRAVQQRRGSSKEQLAYQFNLIQLLDGDLYEAAFDNAEAPSVQKVERYRYFARTMLDGKDFSARIEFCTRPAFAELLQELTRVHNFNCGHFNAQVGEFFDTALSNPDRRDCLIPMLAQEIGLYASLFGEIERPTDAGWVRLEVAPLSVKVKLSVDGLAFERLQRSTHFMQRLQVALNRVYRYSGAVELEWDDDIPF